MHTFLNYFPICHHLFDVPQYVFDLAYVIYSKLYFDYIENAKLYWLTCQKSVKFHFVTTCFMSLHYIHRTFLYACLKNVMSSVNTCGGLSGGRPDVSALEVKQFYCYLLETWSAA